MEPQNEMKEKIFRGKIVIIHFPIYSNQNVTLSIQNLLKKGKEEASECELKEKRFFIFLSNHMIFDVLIPLTL